MDTRVAERIALGIALTALGLVPVMACHRAARRQEVPAVAVTPAPNPPPVPASLSPSAVPGTETQHSTLVPLGVEPEAWRRAVERVEELRGSTGGIDTPSELKHGDDNRRFLATQMADSTKRQYELPHDTAGMAQLIQAGQLVSLPAMGEDYILYEVGTDAREDPLSHYDSATGREVPLFGSFEDFQREDARLDEEGRAPGKAGAKAREDREALDTTYRDPAERDRLMREYRAVTNLVSNLDGFSYNLHNPTDLALLQVKLASYIRPEARDVLLGLAHAYHQRFGRQLPVTSMVRTERYQRRLSRRNPNATEVEIPPHSTGAAFDISYKYMAPDEQNFVMSEIARLKEAGRLEALRERRGHVHVYVFGDGQRPPESLVASFLDSVEAARRLPRGAPNPGLPNPASAGPAVAEAAATTQPSSGSTAPATESAAARSSKEEKVSAARKTTRARSARLASRRSSGPVRGIRASRQARPGGSSPRKTFRARRSSR